jgi:hypothetical protein
MFTLRTLDQGNKNLSSFQSITLSTHKNTNDVNIWHRRNFVEATKAY